MLAIIKLRKQLNKFKIEENMKINTINPSTQQIIAYHETLTYQQVTTKLIAADKSFQTWKKTSFAKRRELMLKLIVLVKKNTNSLANIITQEMGKPLSSSITEIEKCLKVCEYYADNAQQHLQAKELGANKKVVYNPLGIIFAIMPWNFPMWQVFRCAAPTLMAGNAIILKHASNCLGAGEAIVKIFIEAGFPECLFQHLILDKDHIPDIIANPLIKAITLTGSEQAGSIVAAQAAKNIKKSVLELGGNDAYIVLADADLEHAAKMIVRSRMNNCGQSCVGAKRIIAIADIYDELTKLIKIELEQYQMADPLDLDTTLGPMARKDLRDDLHAQVQKSLSMGAKLILGGQMPAKTGFYYPATLIKDVSPGMPAFDEELFGPVISLIQASHQDEAIELANNSIFGLGAAIFTTDIALGDKIASFELEAGNCVVNGFVSSDPALPFGGIKKSGYGRELSFEGIHEFVNAKTVVINEA